MPRLPLVHARPGARAVATLALLVIAAAAACRDGTGPATPTVRVALVSDLVPRIETVADGGARVRCDITLEATLGGARRARWLGGAATFTIGAGASAVTDTLPLPLEELRAAFGTDTLYVKAPVRGGWSFWSDAPYDVTLSLRYEIENGPTADATVPLACRPPLPTSTTPPAITGLTARPIPGADGVLEPGDSVEVSLTATTTGALRSVVLGLEGACPIDPAIFSVPFTQVASRSATFVLPRTCELGTPLSIFGWASDAALQGTERRVALGTTLRDVTPPTLAPLVSATTGSAGSVHYEGDGVYLVPNARDNHELRRVHWEIAGTSVRDSAMLVAAPSAGTPQAISIPLTSAWTGTDVQLRVWATDASGNASAVTTMAGLRVVRAIAPASVVESVPDGTIEHVVDSRRGRAYLLQSGRPRVTIVDLASARAVGEITIPANQVAMDITPDGAWLVLVNAFAPHGLTTISLEESGNPVATLPLTELASGPPRRAHAVRALADGRMFVSATHIAAGGFALMPSVLDVSLRTGAQRLRPDVPAYAAVRATLARSRDGRTLVLGLSNDRAVRYELATDAFGPLSPSLPSSFGDEPPMLGATGAVTIVGARPYRADWSPAPTSPWAASGVGTLGRTGAVLPGDASFVWLTSGGPFFGRATRTSTVDGAPLAAWRPSFAWMRVRAGDDGTLVAVGVDAACATCTRVEVLRLP